MGRDASTPLAARLTGDRATGLHPLADSAYVCGLATSGAAHAVVLRGFGTDDVLSDAPGEDPDLPAGTTRTSSSVTAPAGESGASRVYLGVRVRWHGDHGFLSGTALGEHVQATRLLPLVA